MNHWGDLKRGFGQGFGIALDSSFSAYVTGLTSSANFPTTPGAFQSTAPAGSNGFVTKIANIIRTPGPGGGDCQR